MKSPVPFIAALAAAVLVSCSSELPRGDEAAVEPGNPARTGLPTLALRASNGMYVSCAQTPDSSGQIILVANQPAIGPAEVFQPWYDDNGNMGLKAANGKFITADRGHGGIVLADRDYVGEWESFALIDAGQGRFILKNSNGKFVSADFGLPGSRRGMLVADRETLSDQERFTVVYDPVTEQ